MRVISGTAGRIRLDAPKSMARPSTDRLREALFSILAHRVGQARVLDLFAGSGALGIEALSRGAREATFVDQDRSAIAAVQANLKRTSLADRATVIQREVGDWLRQVGGRSFELVFADPPYMKRPGDRDWASALLSGGLPQHVLAEGGCVVIETGDSSPPSHDDVWQEDDVRSYGDSHLHFFSLRQ